MTTETGDPGAWNRLGGLLIQRRVDLDAAFLTRSAFCKATGLDYRLVYDIEEARRTNFGKTARAALERGYQLRPGTIARVVEGGELEPLQAPALTVQPQAAAPETGELGEEERLLWTRLLNLTRRLGRDPTAAEMFPPGEGGGDEELRVIWRRIWGDTEKDEATRIRMIFRVMTAVGTLLASEDHGNAGTALIPV